METTAQPHRFEIGGVLSDAWGLYTRFFVRFVTVAAVVYVVLGLVQALMGAAAREGPLTALLWGIAGVIVSIVGYFWVQGALVEAVRDVRDGRVDTTVGELFSKVKPVLAALVVAGILAGIAIGVGLLLLLVPGLFLLTRWILIIPVIVLEGSSASESFGRSNELVKGHSWGVFGLVLVVVVLLGILGAILGGIIAAILAFLPAFLVDWLSTLVVNSLIAPFVAIAWTLTYLRLAGASPTVPAAEPLAE